MGVTASRGAWSYGEPSSIWAYASKTHPLKDLSTGLTAIHASLQLVRLVLYECRFQQPKSISCGGESEYRKFKDVDCDWTLMADLLHLDPWKWNPE
jgi:hypothetical protein